MEVPGAVFQDMENDGEDSSMEDRSPSPGSQNSRKRHFDKESDEDMSKRSHYIPDMQNEGTFHLKTLVPSVAAGAIIGKGGETIAQLQKDTNAQVKMSKANEFYPGTMERVCLITGSVEAILNVLSFIMKKIIEKPEVKILVPNSTAGMIIGKGGTYIKQIKEESGAYVQISQKDKDKSLVERCITVNSNDVENSKSACLMILTKIVDDPQSGSCLNVSYTHITGPVANLNPTGSPFANSQSQVTQRGNYGTGISSSMSASSGFGNLLGSGVNLNLNFSSAFPNGGAGNLRATGQALENIRNQLRSSGFTNHSNAEVCQAINTLIYYGIVDVGKHHSS